MFSITSQDIEINLNSLPMVVFVTSLRLSLINARVSNSSLILSRDKLCCLICFCLRTKSKHFFVLEVHKWFRKRGFSQSHCIPLPVSAQGPCALFSIPRSMLIPCVTMGTPLRDPSASQLHWWRHLRSSGFYMGSEDRKEITQTGGQVGNRQKNGRQRVLRAS